MTKGDGLSAYGDSEDIIKHVKLADKLKTQFSLFGGVLIKFEFRHLRGKSKFPLRRIFPPFLFAYTRKGVPVAARATI